MTSGRFEGVGRSAVGESVALRFCDIVSAQNYEEEEQEKEPDRKILSVVNVVILLISWLYVY